jgi:hypothetical protein
LGAANRKLLVAVTKSHDWLADALADPTAEITLAAIHEDLPGHLRWVNRAFG